jgi:hypothetical protein
MRDGSVGAQVRRWASFGRLRQEEVAWSAAILLVGAQGSPKAYPATSGSFGRRVGPTREDYPGFLKKPVFQDTLAEDSVCTTMAGLTSSVVKNLS